MATRSLQLFALLASGFLSFACTGDDGDDGVKRDAGLPRDSGMNINGDGGPRRDTGVARDAGEDRDAGTPDTGVDLSQSIVFLHTNDEHSKLLGEAPNIDDYPTPSTSATVRGGIARRATVMQRLENDANRMPDRPPVVRVGAGDITMGSLFHLGNLQFGVDYALAGALQYDVLTLGNHEFDFGVDFLTSMIANGTLTDPLNLRFGTLRIPLVVSNIRFSMDSTDDDGLAAFYGGGTDQPITRTLIQQHGDVLVGFVGVVGLDAALVAPFKQPVNFSLAVNTTACTSSAECPRSVCVPPADDPTSTSGFCAVDPTGQDAAVNFPALVADIASAVAELRAQGVDMVVAVSHSGIDEREVNTLQMMGMGLENAVRSEEILLARGVDQALTPANVPGIDLIIGGHSHTALQAPLSVPNARSGINTFIVQAGEYGQWVGKVRMTRGSPDVNWELDTTYSGLEPVDATETAQANLVIDGFIDAIVSGLEESGIATPLDGTIFPGEQCDRLGANGALALPNGGNCLNVIPGATGGQLGCFFNNVDCGGGQMCPSRQLDTSQCILAQIGKESCGDSSVDGAEQCDGTNVPLSCAQLGYLGGTMTCHPNCTLNTSQCSPNFLSLLEIVVNFQLDQDESPTVWNGTSSRGDLFNFPMGTTTFDVGEKKPNAESNLTNLVADANRFASNTLVAAHAQDPVEVFIVANGVIRDGLYQGATGVLGLADIFRVVPLGVSPVEMTPGHSLVEANLTAAELKVLFEIGLSAGAESDSFWLGYSGARIEYDPSLPTFDPRNPTTTGQVTRIDLINPGASDAWEDTNAQYEEVPLFDAANGGFGDPSRLIHIGTDVYIALYATAFGLCPRQADGQPFPHCAPCTTNTECTVTDSVCDTTAGVCTGGTPVAFSMRTLAPTAAVGIRQELKEFLALSTYIRRLPNDALPMNYNTAVPRRLCCVGTACATDGSQTCPVRPRGN